MQGYSVLKGQEMNAVTWLRNLTAAILVVLAAGCSLDLDSLFNKTEEDQNQEFVDIATSVEFYEDILIDESMLEITLTSESNEEVWLAFEYSADNWETSFGASIEAVNNTGRFQSSPTGEMYLFVWDTKRDFGDIFSDTVQLKITPFSETEICPSYVSDCLTVDNRNRIPTIYLYEPENDTENHLLTIPYSFSDNENDSCYISFRYSLNSELHDMTPADGYQNNLIVTPDGITTGVFVWDYGADLPAELITLTIAGAIHDAGSTVKYSDRIVSLYLETNTPPEIEFITQPSYSREEPRDLLRFSYKVKDQEQYSVYVKYLYSYDGGLTWKTYHYNYVTVDCSPEGTVIDGHLYFYSEPEHTGEGIMIKILYKDYYDEGIPAVSEACLLPNIIPELVLEQIPDNSFSSIPLYFYLRDMDNDPVTVLLEFSTDNGISFTPGTITGHTVFYPSSLWNLYTAVWDSGTDLHSYSGDVVLRITGDDGFGVTVSFQTAPSVINNASPATGTVKFWGSTLRSGAFDDQSSSPIDILNLSDITSISVGSYHYSAVDSSGRLWSWGVNNSGQLGNDSTFSRDYPSLNLYIDGVIQAESSSDSSYALKDDGTVWSWGSNEYGQLGTSAVSYRYKPAMIDGLSCITQISAGDGFCLALDNRGNVYSWGSNSEGQLGNGTTADNYTPQKIENLSNIQAISCGKASAYALDANGDVWSWGSNSLGQTGNFVFAPFYTTPEQVETLTNISQISAGSNHCIALDSSGNVWAWGNNADAQIGDGTEYERYEPVLINTLPSVDTISANSNTSCAVDTSGTVWVWGAGSYLIPDQYLLTPQKAHEGIITDPEAIICGNGCVYVIMN